MHAWASHSVDRIPEDDIRYPPPVGGAGGLLILLAYPYQQGFHCLFPAALATPGVVEGYRLVYIEGLFTVMVQDLLSTKYNFSLMSYIHHQHHGPTGGSDWSLGRPITIIIEHTTILCWDPTQKSPQPRLPALDRPAQTRQCPWAESLLEHP
jgi:hypothetical protein